MPDPTRSSQRFSRFRPWWALLLPFALWSSDDCPTTLRPGIDPADGTPRQPYLEAPGPGNSARGCGIALEGPTLDPGCPTLTWQRPLAANRNPARARPGAAQVYFFTSPDGHAWSAQRGPIAHSLSSLGLMLTDDSLYLIGSSQIPLLAERAFVTAMRTPDLEQWTGCAWDICREPNRGLVDTQTVRLPDGTWRVWYYSVPRVAGQGFIDPARLPGAHALAFADLAGDRFFARGVGYAAEGLADPSVEYFNGRWIMAATQGHDSVVLAISSDGLRFEATGQRFDRVSVPHLFVDGETLWLVAQRYGGQGGHGPWPYRFTSQDGGTWEDRGYLLEGRPAHGCTSPVVGRFKGQYVLFCSSFEAQPPPP